MVDYLTGKRGAAAMTTPKPFARELYGDRVTLGRFETSNASYTLTRHQLDCWESKLTRDLFRRAAKSIARERAAVAGVRVRILAMGGRVLYTTPENKD